MKIVLVEGGLTLKVETSSVPLLALDTQVLIALGREAASPGSGDVRATEFFKVAQDKVSKGRLLCFETNQREEYLGSNDSAAIAKASLALTRGVRCRHSHDVFKAELEVGMRAFLSGGMEIVIPMNARFDCNPDDVAKGPKGRVHRSTVGLADPIAVLSRVQKPADVIALSNIKKAYSGLTYDQALSRELRALALRFYSGQISDADANEYIDLWHAAGGSRVDVQRFAEFLCSAYSMHIPKNEIGASIFADLMVDRKPIQTGDLHDSSHLATALPVARYVLTDANMKDRLRRRKLDRRWAVDVFSLRTLGTLSSEIRKL